LGDGKASMGEALVCFEDAKASTEESKQKRNLLL
jgi:hypothetical protein